MRSIWIIYVILNLIVCTYAGPIEVIYSGDGCDCPAKLNYQVNVPQLPAPQQYKLTDYGYKIDVPPVQGKAKVSYTFDFSVEEPKPPCPKLAEKLNLLAKVDRIALNKADCQYSYDQTAPSCRCGQCGVTKPKYRYVSRRSTLPCRCRHPKCKCNSRAPSSVVRIQATPVLVASGSLERTKRNTRRKRDLERIFFRPRRQDRSARYVKLYHKPLSTTTEKENDDLPNTDFFSEANPLKRKTKKVLFPFFRSKIVKRDIKGEYDLLEKERQEMDLTLPEIIQFMPETLQPDFKRGTSCQFGCDKKLQLPKEVEETNRNQEKLFNETQNTIENIETEGSESGATPSPADDEGKGNDETRNTFTKRNANCCQYPSADVQSPYGYVTTTPYAAQSQRDPSSMSLCAQRKLYAAMRSAASLQPPAESYNVGSITNVQKTPELKLFYPPSSAVPDPFRPDAIPMYYTGDLETPEYRNYAERLQDPILESSRYPVQHVSKEDLDGIISDIVYRHPDFIEASSHYGGALVDPEPEQIEQTKDFIKKLINGRLGLLNEEPFDTFFNYGVPGYQSPMYNPYMHSGSVGLLPAIY